MLVSVIIPTYNRANFLGETLDSVLSQTYKDWECLVIDDTSNDYTDELLNFYVNKDPRISYYKRPKDKLKGASSCRNIGIAKAKGDLFQFLDSDDLLGERKIEEQVKAYKTGSLNLMTGRWGWFKESSALYERFKYEYHSYREFNKPIDLLSTMGIYHEYLPLHNYLIPSFLIEKAGLWNEDLSTNDDGEFMTRVILNASKVVFVHASESFYRFENTDKLSEVSTKEQLDSLIESWKLIEDHINQVSKETSNPYVARAKQSIYEIIRKFEPGRLEVEKDFLSDRYNDDGSFFKKVFQKLKKIPLNPFNK